VQVIAEKEREPQDLVAMERSTKHGAIVAVNPVFSAVGASNPFIPGGV